MIYIVIIERYLDIIIIINDTLVLGKGGPAECQIGRESVAAPDSPSLGGPVLPPPGTFLQPTGPLLHA